MIESTVHQVADIQHLVQQASFSSFRNQVTQDIIVEKTLELVRHNTTIFYFIRISWLQKLNFLAQMSQRLRSLTSICKILNSFYWSTGKITSYCKATPKRPIPYDSVLNDHCRMLNEEQMRKIMQRDLAIFQAADDDDQVALLVALLRIAGGAVIDAMYKHLQEVYYLRIQHLTKESSSVKSKDTDAKDEEDGQNWKTRGVASVKITHNPDDPKHQECEMLTKKWNDMIQKYRQKVKRESPKVEKKKDDKKKGKKNKKSKKGKDKKSKKGKNKKSKKGKKGKAGNELDWIEIMPIFLVKKIFTHLDKKSLKKAKAVSEYWSWVIADLAKEQKAMKLLRKTIKKMKIDELSSTSTSVPTKVKNSTERRVERLLDRGAILEKLRYIVTKPETDECLIIKSLEVAPYNVTFLEDVMMYPRILRHNPPLYKKPTITCKDFNIICSESSTTNVPSDEGFFTPRLVSEYSTMSSEEIEY